MKALGKGSFASLVEVVLALAWWCLWIALAALTLGAIVYAGLSAFTAAGWINPNVLGDFISPPVLVAAFAAGVLAVVGALVIVGRLRRLFDSFTSGEPFRRENADHLRVIWITMLVIEIARYALLAVVAAVFGATGVQVKDFELNIDLSTWMSIAILIVLAEVFREGARLREEQELTI